MPVTADATEWWIGHAQRSGEPWAMFYWDDWKASHRSHIALALSLLPPVESVYEIGCNAGPNLRLIRHHFPHIRLGGSDLCPVAVQVGSEKLGIPLDVGVVPDILEEDGRCWDVMLSCYTMAYLDPDTAYTTLAALSERARVALILVEPMPLGMDAEGLCRVDLPEWRHDYRQMLDQRGWSVEWKWPVLPPVGNVNACLVTVARRS